MKAMCPKPPNRDGSSLRPEHRPTGKAPGLAQSPLHRIRWYLNKAVWLGFTPLLTRPLQRCIKAACLSLVRTIKARLWGPFRSHLFPVCSSEQAFPQRFCCKPWSGGTTGTDKDEASRRHPAVACGSCLVPEAMPAPPGSPIAQR